MASFLEMTDGRDATIELTSFLQGDKRKTMQTCMKRGCGSGGGKVGTGFSKAVEYENEKNERTLEEDIEKGVHMLQTVLRRKT